MTGDALEHRRIEAQIGDHMVNELAQFSFEEPIYQVEETQTLKPVTVRENGATVVRTYLPEYTLEASKAPRITITPFGFDQSYATRNRMFERYFLDIVVHQRLVGNAAEREESDEQRSARWAANITKHGDHVTKIAEQIRLYFEKQPMQWAKIEGCEGCDCARWMQVQGSPMYESSIVEQQQIVLSVQRHQWLTVREMCGCG